MSTRIFRFLRGHLIEEMKLLSEYLGIKFAYIIKIFWAQNCVVGGVTNAHVHAPPFCPINQMAI